MRSAAEASERTLQALAPLAAERVGLVAAHGRVLAESPRAELTLPPWANSAMDGYAVRAADVAGATPARPVTLPVLETVAAGAFPTRPLPPGAATRIMTGAPVPDGADSVVRVEDTDGGVTQVQVRDARDAGRNVRRAGEDVWAGDVVLEAGTILRGAQVGLLAAAGVAGVNVHRRPRVAIISTGDELVALDRLDEARQGKRIISSNGYALAALVREAGGEPVELGIVPDAINWLRAKLHEAASCDLIVTTAGVSVGEFDYTRAAVEQVGGTIDFWKVRMRPGAQLGFGTVRGTPWLGLPGNPVSAIVTFELFVRPMVRRLLGHRELFPRAISCVAGEAIRSGGGATYLLRAMLDESVTPARATLAGGQGSHVQLSLGRANALLVIPPDVSEAPPGTALRAIPLGERMTFASEFPF